MTQLPRRRAGWGWLRICRRRERSACSLDESGGAVGMGDLLCLILYIHISKLRKKVQEGQCESAPAEKKEGLPSVIDGGWVKGYGIAAPGRGPKVKAERPRRRPFPRTEKARPPSLAFHSLAAVAGKRIPHFHPFRAVNPIHLEPRFHEPVRWRQSRAMFLRIYT